ncbi:MAG: diaminopimelate epimerase [Steroidobacteraceae bacterium]|nr:diaminopimelate epimerase [Steroidobacteraceae bacterium]
MRLDFTKMHGLGNDFIVFEARQPGDVPSAVDLRRLADRRTGIGFDQALVLAPPRQAGTDVYYRIFNADGSEVEQCGNGARCIARLVASRAAIRDRALAMDSPGGVVQARLRSDGLVSVAMGVPNFDPRSLPFTADREAASYRIDLESGAVEFGAVSIGNPHAVIRVRSAQDAPVDTVGPAMENHARFPRRVNVGFLEIVAPDHVRLRVFERGAGETLACGTGACAAVAVGRRHGPLAEEVRVDVPGGRLIVQWPGPGEPIWLTGPAETAFTGQVELPDAPGSDE